MAYEKCADCGKMHYATDRCAEREARLTRERQVAPKRASKEPGPSTKPPSPQAAAPVPHLAAPVAASTPSPGAPDSTLGDAGHLMVGIVRKPRGSYRSGQKGAASKSAKPKSRAKATKATREAQSPMDGEADGVASRLSAGRTAQGAAATVASPAIKRGRGRPPGPVPFDKKAHDRKMAAQRRALLKAQKESVK